MSMMEELKFFLGILINQCKDGVYVHQSKYTKELLKKFNLQDCKLMTTRMHPTCNLSKNDKSKKVDQKVYIGMIYYLIYLTVIDLIFYSVYIVCQISIRSWRNSLNYYQENLYKKSQDYKLVRLCDVGVHGIMHEVHAPSFNVILYFSWSF